MKDQYKREINYLRISVTDLCNFRCKYCMPHEGIEKLSHHDILSLEEILQVVKASVSLGINKIRITGGEPLIRKNIVTLIKEIKLIEGIREIAMTTNGYLLDTYLDDLILAGLDRVNISLDTLNQAKFEMITRGGDFNKVYQGLMHAIQSKIKKVKLNVVLIGGFNNDEIEDFVELTKKYPIDVRFIELMSIGEAANWAQENFLRVDEVLKVLPELGEVTNKSKQSPATLYTLPGAIGNVGLIRPMTCKFCENCNRIRLTADGHIKSCLHSNELVDVKQILREANMTRTQKDKNLAQLLEDTIWNKPKEHHLEDGEISKRNMVQIGG